MGTLVLAAFIPDQTIGARVGLAAFVGAALWAAWRLDNHTGSCLIMTVLVLIVLAILAMLVAGMALPG